MITKSIDKKSPGKSSMRRLVQYLTATQGKSSRVDEVRITNCIEDTDPTLAAIEIEAIQKQNRRSRCDKTYHLLVSFRTGEEPDAETLRKIERDLCEALGYAEHQRIAVIHRDTDNTHMHIAINKVHHETMRTHTPHYDKLRLKSARIEIERKYGLLLESGDEQQTEKVTQNQKSRDMEQQAGMESLETWIKRNCLDSITRAESWQDLHNIMAQNGLELKNRGNGFIFRTGEGVTIKTSSVDRALSKSKLEQRFGPLQASTLQRIQPLRTYQTRQIPTGTLEATSLTLFDEYKTVRQQFDNKRSMVLQALSEERKQRIATSKALKDAECKTIRSSKWSPTNKLRYEIAQREHRARIFEINRNIHDRRKAIYAEMGKLSWLAWLQKQAESGREDAVLALRKRAHGLAKKFNTSEITGERQENATVFENHKIDAVTKKGTILYHVGNEIIRHEAHAYRVSDESSIETTIMALQMAQKRFGKELEVNGTVAFKQKIIEAAVMGNLKISFTEKYMEEERKKLMALKANQNIHTATRRKSSHEH